RNFDGHIEIARRSPAGARMATTGHRDPRPSVDARRNRDRHDLTTRRNPHAPARSAGLAGQSPRSIAGITGFRKHQMPACPSAIAVAAAGGTLHGRARNASITRARGAALLAHDRDGALPPSDRLLKGYLRGRFDGGATNRRGPLLG